MSKYNSLRPNNDTCTLCWTPAKDNSWDWEETTVEFKGRIAGRIEKKRYNIQKGVVNSDVDTYIIATNMPEEINTDDRIIFLGKEYIVTSVGYYLDQNMLVDFGAFDPEYVKAVSPKGITLK